MTETETLRIYPDTGELRVLIASATADMAGEREYLSRAVFPELREHCSGRGVVFTGIDLTRDAEPAAVRHSRIERLSVDEIRRRRPFLLGLLGPEYRRDPVLATALRELGVSAPAASVYSEPPADSGGGPAAIGRSVLDAPEWAAFYFRASRLHPAGLSPQDLELEELKHRIRRGGFRFRDDLPDVRAFGSWVRAELLHVVDRTFPARHPVAPFDAELRAQEVFAASRRKGYVPRPALLDRLDRHVDSHDPPLIVRGEPGSGKSALVAYWSAEYRRRFPDARLIVHHVGVGCSTDRAELLRSLIGRIREAADGGGPIPGSAAELEEALPFWLAEAAAVGAILVVDGADQLDEGSSDLEWLPSYIPPALRLIVTANRPATASGPDRLELPIEPLSVSERIALRSSLLGPGEAGRDGDLDTISSANPLLLRTRIEELRLLGISERASGAVERFLTASTVEDLFDRKLERLESEFGERVAGDLLGVLWGARRGLDESELEKIVACSRLDLADLLSALDFYLLRIDGRLRFFHAELTRAVERRYAADDEKKRKIHLRLADSFEPMPVDGRRADELPWQLLRAGALDRLRACIADPDLLRIVVRDEAELDLAGYWTACGGAEVMEAAYREELARLDDGAFSDAGRLDLVRVVAGFFRACGRYSAAAELLRDLLPDVAEMVGHDDLAAAAAAVDLAESYIVLGRLDEAERILRHLHRLRERLLGAEHPETIAALESLAGVAHKRGDYAAAELLFRAVLRHAEAGGELDGVDVARALNNLASVMHARGELAEAESLYRMAHRIWRRSRGPDHPETAIALNNLAAVLYDRGGHAEAEELYGGAVAVWERSLGPSHPIVADALANLGSTIAARSPSESLPHLERAAAIHRGVYGERPHSTTALLCFTLGRTHFFLGNLDESESWYRRAHAMQCALFGADNVDAAVSLAGLARVLRDAGRLQESLTAFEAALDVLERRLGGENQRVGHTLAELADLHVRIGAVMAARRAALRALAILEQADTVNHPKVEQVRRLLETIG